MEEFLQKNRAAYDLRVLEGERHTRTVLARDLKNPLPIIDPENWLEGNVQGKPILCLASGGGLQSALLAAAGAIVTVLDISGEMLRLDREIAAEHHLQLQTIQGTMEDLSMFGSGSFQVVLQPVSSCYIPQLHRLHAEVARILEPKGIYISQHKQPASLQGDALPHPGAGGYLVRTLYNHAGALPQTSPCLHREWEMVEFLHPWETLIGGLCRAGFVVEDLVEPQQKVGDANFLERSRYLPPYVKIKARRTEKNPAMPSVIWTPS
ncbi:MAG: class I SAM-dependent methyltransferase [Verrucomicrobiota bacterium]|nr:class I SAM-dependent methyltransferase [Verrucomicrobiota bacterium]